MTTTAFDAQAAAYDDVAESALGVVLRARVHHVLEGLTSPSDTVIDLGCGTGIDAAWLAPQVRSLVAFDASAEMVELTQHRCRDLDNVVVRQADLAAEDALTDLAPADIVLANFGVVNCIGDLAAFGRRLHSVMTPGGTAVIVTMARWCPIELSIGLATGNWQLIRRRMSGATSDEAYPGLALRYASARELARAFGAGFELEHAESLGSALPPFEQRRWLENRPGFLRVLAATDQRIATSAARLGLGDHHIAVLRRLP